VSGVLEDSSASIIENKQSKQRRSAGRSGYINPTTKVLRSFDAPGNIYTRTHQNIPQDLNVQEHRYQNLQFGTNSVCCVDMSTKEHKQKHIPVSSTFYSAVHEYYGYRRIKINQEINDILKGQTITGFITKQRLNWLGHVERKAEDNIVQKIKRWKPMSERPIGRPKTRWKDDVLEDIKSINISIWKKVTQNRDRWKKVVEQVRTLYRL